MSILNLPFMTPRFEEHEVAGVPTKFYGITPGTLGALRGIAKPFFKAVSVLFSSAEKDGGAEQSYSKKGEDISQNTKSTPATPETLKLRTEQRSQAVEQVIESLMGEASMYSLAMVICDALRMPALSEADRKKFLDTLPMESLIELLKGIASVNKKAFAPLLEWAGVSPTALRKAVESRLRVVQSEDSTTSSTSSATT